MRRIACSCAIALSLAACGRSSRDRTVTVSEQSNATTIAMGVGEHLTVAGRTSVVATAVRSWSGETLTFSVTVTVQ